MPVTVKWPPDCMGNSKTNTIFVEVKMCFSVRVDTVSVAMAAISNKTPTKTVKMNLILASVKGKWPGKVTRAFHC